MSQAHIAGLVLVVVGLIGIAVAILIDKRSKTLN